MRVLCSTRPMDGGFGPFTPLGRALVEGEHEVIVASGSEPASACRRERPGVRGGGSAGHGRAMAAMADTEVKEAPPGDRIAFPAAMFGSVHPSAKLPALRELEASRPVDLILHPPVDLSGPLLAAELGVPSVCYGFGQPFDPDVVAAMAARARPLWERAGIEPDPHGGIYRGRYLDPRPPRLCVGETVPAASGTHPIRPEIPRDPGATLPVWAEQLGTARSCTSRLAPRRCSTSRRSSLRYWRGWRAKRWRSSSPSAELNDPTALGELPATVHVEPWLPLAPLLPHCDAVLCHGGTEGVVSAVHQRQASDLRSASA